MPHTSENLTDYKLKCLVSAADRLISSVGGESSLDDNQIHSATCSPHVVKSLASELLEVRKKLPGLLADQAMKKAGWTEAFQQEDRAEKAERMLSQILGKHKPIVYIDQDMLEAMLSGDRAAGRVWTQGTDSMVKLYKEPPEPRALRPPYYPNDWERWADAVLSYLQKVGDVQTEQLSSWYLAIREQIKQGNRCE